MAPPTELPTALPLTGERTVPGIAAENYWFRRHEAAYEWLRTRVHGGTLLEVGCGEGYGTALLADSGATRVIGLDYDATTIIHAAARYPRARFVRANLAALPVGTGSVDVLAGLQVIEHVWHHAQFVDECRRVLRPDGVLIMTTPNRLTFSPGLDGPVNPFHTREFTATELASLLTSRGLRVDRLAGLHAGPRLRALDAAHGGSFVAAQLATAPGDWSTALRRDVASITTADFAVGAAQVDSSLDLIVVATRATSSGTAPPERA